MSSVHFDKSKGLAWQVLQKDWEFEEYMKWVNEPKHIANVAKGLQMFDTPIFETISKQPWQYVLFFWTLILI